MPTCGLGSLGSPLIPNENTFNPCFLLLLLSSLAVAYLIFGTIRLYKTVYSPKYGTLLIKNTGFIHFIRGGLTVLHTLLYIYLCSFVSIHERFADQLILGFFPFTVLLLVVIVPLQLIETLHRTVSSDLLILFWPIVTVWQVALWYQDHFTRYKLIKLTSSADAIHRVEFFLILNSIAIFWLEYAHWRPSKALVFEYKKNGDGALLETPNLIDRETFMWMNNLISESYKNEQVVHTELPNSPAKLSTEASTTKLRKHWNPKDKNALLVRLIAYTFGPLALASFFFELLSDLPYYVEPQLLRILIRHFDEANPQIIKGILISLLMLLTTMIRTALYNNYVLLNLELGLGCRASLTSLIYQKSLQLSTDSKKKYSSGDVINLMSVDVNKIQAMIQDMSTFILAPTNVVLSILSLWPLLGKATLTSVVVVIVLVPINVVLVRWLKTLGRVYMKKKDARTQVINEILTSIKSIKLYAWEVPMLSKLYESRVNGELKTLAKLRVVGQLANFVWVLIPFFISLSAFSAFVLFDDRKLTADIVFPALTLLNLLLSPLLQLPLVITTAVEASVSLTRINDFLLTEELDNELVTKGTKKSNSGEVAVLVKNTSFLWSSNLDDLKYALKDINFTAKKGELSCVVGRVGSGKTSLLYGLLGQLPVAPGNPAVNISGTIAYCAQLPWIMNASVKENVLFGCKFDKPFYEQTLEACQLLPDLDILPDGDETLVGEKGVSLSGGQKARLALARAVYARADVYLLDDILSAVDSHVGKLIIDSVLLGLLRTKTIVLVTNSISVLNFSESISLIKSGSIVETCSFADIGPTNHPDLHKLISEFGREEKSPSKEQTPEKSIPIQTPFESPQESDLEEPIVDLIVEQVPTYQSVIPSNASLRRASVATFNWEPIKKLMPHLRSGQNNEVLAKGKVKRSVYIAYIKACSIPGVIVWMLFLLVGSLLSVGGNYWLKYWTESSSEDQNVWTFIIVYALFGLGSSLMSIARGMVLMLWLAMNALIKIHGDMASRILRAPMLFFEKTPVGRIMNRFTNDVSKIDTSIPSTFAGFVGQLTRTVLTLAVVGYAMPFYILIIIFLSTLYLYYEIFYVSILRSLKRLVAISRSPIYAHLGESLNGLDTIKAYDQVGRFDFINHANVDFNLKSVYMLRLINRWLYFRLQVIGSLGVFSALLLAIYTLTTASPLTSAMAGFVMSYALQVTSSLSRVVRMSAEVETSIVAVERCLEYCDLPVEELDELLAKMIKPPLDWTQSTGSGGGSIKFVGYSTRYRANLDLILRNITMEIKQGEKIGVVGRTGAGKSSLALSIFRIIEPVEGHIEIDGLNTSGISLHDLRRHLGIIPQDSQLIEGTIRQNLDPFNYYTEEEIWNALELAHLKEHIENMDQTQETAAGEEPVVITSNLDFKVYEGGSNFSSGQRQLISLARVLLRMRNSSILVLDEATAAIDVETDKIIQETIRKEFKDKTIITIAHRLETVIDSDRIVSLDKGELKEFDSPENLLKSEAGIFYGLCKQAGLT